MKIKESLEFNLNWRKVKKRDNGFEIRLCFYKGYFVFIKDIYIFFIFIYLYRDVYIYIFMYL